MIIYFTILSLNKLECSKQRCKEWIPFKKENNEKQNESLLLSKKRETKLIFFLERMFRTL